MSGQENSGGSGRVRVRRACGVAWAHGNVRCGFYPFDGPRIVVAVHAFLAALAAAKEKAGYGWPSRSARPIRSSSRAVGFTAGGAGVVGSSMACEEQWAGSSMIDATGER